MSSSVLAATEWPRMWLVLGLVLLVSIVMAALIQRRACSTFHKFLDRTAQRLLAKLGRRPEKRATVMR